MPVVERSSSHASCRWWGIGRLKESFRKKRGPLPAGQDPQQNTGETTFSQEHLVKMAKASVASYVGQTLRNWAMMVWQALTVGRGEDVRQRHINEIMAPLFISSIGGPPRAWLGGRKGAGRLKGGTGLARTRKQPCALAPYKTAFLVARVQGPPSAL